jgi:chromosome segregation ATPase
MGQIHKHESKLTKAEAMAEQQQLDLNTIRAELRRAETMRDEKLHTMQQLESGLLRTQQVSSGLREEVNSAFEEPSSQQSTEAEQQLQGELQALRTASAKAATERAVLERQRNALRITLADNLLRRVQELQHRSTALEMEAADTLVGQSTHAHVHSICDACVHTAITPTLAPLHTYTRKTHN